MIFSDYVGVSEKNPHFQNNCSIFFLQITVFSGISELHERNMSGWFVPGLGVNVGHVLNMATNISQLNSICRLVIPTNSKLFYQ